MFVPPNTHVYVMRTQNGKKIFMCIKCLNCMMVYFLDGRSLSGDIKQCFLI